jgi:hypothetical protein
VTRSPTDDRASKTRRPASPLLVPATRCHSAANAVGNTPVLWLDDPFQDSGTGLWANWLAHAEAVWTYCRTVAGPAGERTEAGR